MVFMWKKHRSLEFRSCIPYCVRFRLLKNIVKIVNMPSLVLEVSVDFFKYLTKTIIFT